MSNTQEPGGRKRVGPEDEAREDQMDESSTTGAERKPGVTDDEDRHGIEHSNDLKTP